MAPWIAAMWRTHTQLKSGKTVVVHCKGGLGRTGTFAASVLTTFGVEPAEAIRAVREARPGTIENTTQEEFVGRAREHARSDARSRIRGCLLAGAVGDALGGPVEFMKLAEIRRALRLARNNAPLGGSA